MLNFFFFLLGSYTQTQEFNNKVKILTLKKKKKKF